LFFDYVAQLVEQSSLKRKVCGFESRHGLNVDDMRCRNEKWFRVLYGWSCTGSNPVHLINAML
jgi:hypothetical protein